MDNLNQESNDLVETKGTYFGDKLYQYSDKEGSNRNKQNQSDPSGFKGAETEYKTRPKLENKQE